MYDMNYTREQIEKGRGEQRGELTRNHKGKKTIIMPIIKRLELHMRINAFLKFLQNYCLILINTGKLPANTLAICTQHIDA